MTKLSDNPLKRWCKRVCMLFPVNGKKFTLLLLLENMMDLLLNLLFTVYSFFEKLSFLLQISFLLKISPYLLNPFSFHHVSNKMFFIFRAVIILPKSRASACWVKKQTLTLWSRQCKVLYKKWPTFHVILSRPDTRTLTLYNDHPCARTIQRSTDFS